MLITKKEAAEIGRKIGMTIKWDPYWEEFSVYPKGTGKFHPSAYFPTDVEDAVFTAIQMQNQHFDVCNALKREFTTTEEADLSCNSNHWFVETDYADHPIGDRLFALGNNIYGVRRAEGDLKLFTKLSDAMEG